MNSLFSDGLRPLDHVAVAVPSIEAACTVYELLGGHACSPVETLESQGVRVAFCGAVELLEPLGPDTPVGRFLARRGPGLHHVAYRSADIDADLDWCRREGLELIDSEARPGARGHRVAFLHPRAAGGVLIELVETGALSHPA